MARVDTWTERYFDLVGFSKLAKSLADAMSKSRPGPLLRLPIG
jgi:hypothetical protein